MSDATSAAPPQAPLKPDRTWDILCHVIALTGFITGGLGFIVGPLVIWLIKKDQIPSVNEHGKESLNFQISMLIYSLVSALLIVVFVGFLLLIAIGLADLILVIIATVKASNGEPYRYPLTIRLIK